MQGPSEVCSSRHSTAVLSSSGMCCMLTTTFSMLCLCTCTVHVLSSRFKNVFIIHVLSNLSVNLVYLLFLFSIITAVTVTWTRAHDLTLFLDCM